MRRPRALGGAAPGSWADPLRPSLRVCSGVGRRLWTSVRPAGTLPGRYRTYRMMMGLVGLGIGPPACYLCGFSFPASRLSIAPLTRERVDARLKRHRAREDRGRRGDATCAASSDQRESRPHDREDTGRLPGFLARAFATATSHRDGPEPGSTAQPPGTRYSCSARAGRRAGACRAPPARARRARGGPRGGRP